MEKIIKKYEEYKSDFIETWKARFTWCGLNGKYPKYTTTIIKFFKETNILDTIERVYSSEELFHLVNSLASKYVDWVKSKDNNYKKADFDDMRDFFVGAIGEFFYVSLLENVRCILVHNPQSGEIERFDFHYVSPALKDDKDFGIDLTGVANDKPSVFQVKWWNPYNRELATIELFQKADSEGSRNGFINQDEDKNIFLCWLGSEEKGYRRINENKVFKNKVVVIGSRSLDMTINGRNKIFWDGFYDGLKNLYAE